MTPNTTMARRRCPRRLWSLVLSLLLLATACSSNDEDSSTADSGFDTAGVATDAEMEPDEVEVFAEQRAVEDAASDEASADGVALADSGAPASAATPTGLTPADLGRDIIFTAEVEVDVDDVASAGEEAVAAIDRLGGFVFGQESIGGAEPSSIFTFKVRPADFGRALETLAGIGDLRNQSVSADDVTERVVDIESRIQVAELGVERLRAALEATVSLDDFAEVERLLIDRETELELLRGQLRSVQDQIDLATITLILSQDRVQNNLELVVSVYEEHDDGLACPGQQDLSVEAKTDLTVCFELVNTGDQTLGELTLTDTGLGIDAETALISVFGGLDDSLAPGQSLIVAFETSPERDLRLRTRAGGQPVAVEGGEPAGPPVSTVRNLDLRVRPGDDAPGFSDGFGAGRDLLAGLWSIARVVVGFLVPLLVLLPFFAAFGWLAAQWRKRSAVRRAHKRAAKAPMAPPPPSFVPPSPPTPPADVGAKSGTDG